MRNQSSIYNLARVAKDRLKNNNYDKTRDSYGITSISPFERYLQENKQHHKKIIREEKEVAVNSYEEDLYRKVCDMLSSGVNVVNPILELMDKNLFRNLDAEAKQRYLNKLNDKYKELKQRYYKEHYLRYLAL